MRKLNLELMIRNIVQDELEKAFGTVSSDSSQSEQPEETINLSRNEEAENDEIVLTPIEKTGSANKSRKKSGRGRVTKTTDKRLKANKQR